MNEFAPGYNLSDDKVDMIRILDGALERHAGVDVGDIEVFKDRDPASLFPLIRALEARGWAGATGMVPSTVRLLPSGVQAITWVREQRKNVGERRRAAANSVMQWLHNTDPGPNRDDMLVQEIMETPYALYYGQPFTEQEIQRAVNYLGDRGLVDGVRVEEHGLVRIKLTPTGEDVVDLGYPVEEFVRRGMEPANPNVNISGSNVNWSNNSPGASQSITVIRGAHAEDTKKIADALSGLMDVLGLDAAQRQEAVETVEDLRQAADDPQPEPGRLVELYNKASAVAVAGTAPVLGAGVVELVKQAFQALGMA